MNLLTLTVLAYVLAQLAFGAWIGRKVKTEEDYLLAGRSLSVPLLSFTVFATWFGAETCIGSAGSIYEKGLTGGSADPFGYGLCILLMGTVFALPLWRMGLTTAADFFRLRYSPIVEKLAVLITVPTSLLWAAAQIRAFGQVISALSGIPPTTTITLAAAVVVLYTLMGGFLADVWTDVVQGAVLVAGLIVLMVAVLAQHGTSVLAEIEPQRLRLVDPSLGLLPNLETWAIPIIGSVMAPELIGRVIAARSGTVSQRGTLIAGGAYLLIGLVPATLGLLGFVLLPGLEHPEQVLPLLAEQHLPSLLYVVFAGAILSAILSTADSTLLVSTSLVTHNLLLPRFPGLSERHKVLLTRIGVATFGVLAYVFAFSADGVYDLVVQASAFGSTGLFVTVTVGLFSRRGGTPAAVASLLAGVASWILGAYVVGWRYPFLGSLAAAAGAFALFAVLRPEPPADDGAPR